jgi:hypothetical protein
VIVMNTSVPTTGPTPDDQSSGAPLPASPGQPTSPGPNPDDLDDERDDARTHGAANATPAVSPTNPGPNPDDLDQ